MNELEFEQNDNEFCFERSANGTVKITCYPRDLWWEIAISLDEAQLRALHSFLTDAITGNDNE